MIIVLLTALAGGFGAAARLGSDTAMKCWRPEGWLRLMIINGSGSTALGLLTGLAVPPELQLIVGAGFLGGYTTFSAASLATVELAEERRRPSTLLSSVGMLVASTAAAALGLVVGRAL